MFGQLRDEDSVIITGSHSLRGHLDCRKQATSHISSTAYVHNTNGEQLHEIGPPGTSGIDHSQTPADLS